MGVPHPLKRQGDAATTRKSKAGKDAFEVPWWVDVLGGSVTRYRRVWTGLGNFESKVLSTDLSDIRIDRPIYITGLARSGSTILLELLSRHADAATHRYKDYPLIFTPVLWNLILTFAGQEDTQPAERTHQDGIYVTPESPEALEEMLWMAFFPRLHNPLFSAALGGGTENPAFEAFYRDHIRKLLWLRNRRRYLAKGNYNLTRIEYLQRLFPDARFVIPVRDPVWHTASLMKQHALFCKGERHSPRALSHMRRLGHFEFGLDWRPVNTGRDDEMNEILNLWERGRALESWALYWRHLYGFVAERLESNPWLRRACLIIRSEDLCRDPRSTLAEVFDHCGLPTSAATIARLAEEVKPPNRHKSRVSRRDREIVAAYTKEIANRFGYGA